MGSRDVSFHLLRSHLVRRDRVVGQDLELMMNGPLGVIAVRIGWPRPAVNMDASVQRHRSVADVMPKPASVVESGILNLRKVGFGHRLHVHAGAGRDVTGHESVVKERADETFVYFLNTPGQRANRL